MSFLGKLEDAMRVKTENFTSYKSAGSDVNTIDRVRSTVLPGQDKVFPSFVEWQYGPQEGFMGDAFYNNFRETR